MHARARWRFTEAEYLAIEEASDQKHEFIDGQVIAMAGGSEPHNVISLNIGAELRAGLRRAGCSCRAYSSDQRIAVQSRGTYVYADASVACQPIESDGQTLLNPRVVVEVLSPSTRDDDRGTKLAGYLSIPSVTDVLLVEQHIQRVEHHRRVGPGASSCEVVTAGAVKFEGLGFEIPLSEIYFSVELPG